VSDNSAGVILFAKSITAHLQEEEMKFSPRRSKAPPCERSKLYFAKISTKDGYCLSATIPD